MLLIGIEFSEQMKDSLPDWASTTLQVISAFNICGTFLCLSATLYNVYAYLYKMKIKKRLINAFYISLVVMLLASFVEWSCSLANP